MLPPKLLGELSIEDLDKQVTKGWIKSLPDGAIRPTANSYQDGVDTEFYRLIEDEWWNRHAIKSSAWPIIEMTWLPEPVTYTVFCGALSKELEARSTGPEDLKHQSSRRLPYLEGEYEDFFIECACGWKEPQGFSQTRRESAWWWPTVTNWDSKALTETHFLVCGSASSLADRRHAPQDYEGPNDCFIPAGRRTTDHLFTKCICGANLYWPESYQLIPIANVTEEEYATSFVRTRNDYEKRI